MDSSMKSPNAVDKTSLVTELDKQLDQLFASVEMLENRLGPYLLPAFPEPGTAESADDNPEESPLRSALIDISGRLRRVTAYVDRLNDRVDRSI